MTDQIQDTKQAVCAALYEAGVSDAQIKLALETSGALLDQLASTPVEVQQSRSVAELFARLVPAGE